MEKITSLFLLVVEKIKSGSLSFSKIILIAFMTILGLFVLLAFLQLGFIYWIYAMVENWITVRLGFDYYVSNFLATCFVSLFTVLLPTFLWYVLLGKKKAWGIGIMIGIQLLMCVGVYTLGKSVCFDRRTGKPLCYFADTPKGRIWSYSPGFDPESGKRFTLYTREIREAEDQRKKLK